MLVDQRRMSGERPLTTPAEVADYWDSFAREATARRGYPFPNRQDGTGYRTSRKKLVPYLNHSRWVADCPMDGCNGGIAVWQENPKAACLDCGTIFTQIDWPTEEDINKVLATALQVTILEERNWRLGESADSAVKRMREFLL